MVVHRNHSDPESCANCGEKIGRLEVPYLWENNIVCADCYERLGSRGSRGQLLSKPVSTPIATPTHSEEVVLYKNAGVFLSSTRLMLGGDTYRLANLTSVRAGKKKRGDAGVYGLLFLGIALLLAVFLGDEIKHDLSYLAFPAMSAVVAVPFFVVAVSKKDVFAVVITTSAGEMHAVEFMDIEYCKYFLAFLTKAMSSAGTPWTSGIPKTPKYHPVSTRRIIKQQAAWFIFWV